MIKTAAGNMTPEYQVQAHARGGTTVWFGQLEDGRWATASRWQYECISGSRRTALRVFTELSKGVG